MTNLLQRIELRPMRLGDAAPVGGSLAVDPVVDGERLGDRARAYETASYGGRTIPVAGSDQF